MKKVKLKKLQIGNGGIYEAMEKSGVLADIKQRGVQWIFVGGIDNILLNVVDPILLALTIEEQNKIASKSVAKAYPKEKAGVFCKMNGKPRVIEYTELPDEMAEETNEKGELIFGEMNILSHLFHITALEDLAKAKLPYHIAFKKSNYLNEKGQLVEPEEPNIYKFEAFIFDAFARYENMTILRVKREEEFAPVKNRIGNDSPQTATLLYNEKMKSRKEV